MHVYRIESRKYNEDGIYNIEGMQPYRYTRSTPLAKNYSEFHSNPFGDKGLNDCPHIHGRRAWNRDERHIDEGWHCAFKSIEQFHSWFPQEKLTEMQREVGHIVTLGVYDVKEGDYYASDKQVLFDMTKAKRLKSLSVDHFNS